MGKPDKDGEREKDDVLGVSRSDSMDPSPQPPIYCSDSRPNMRATDSQSTLVGSDFEADSRYDRAL